MHVRVFIHASLLPTTTLSLTAAAVGQHLQTSACCDGKCPCAHAGAAGSDLLLGPLQPEDQVTTVNLTQNNLNSNVWMMG